jgi:hypothetical protein
VISIQCVGFAPKHALLKRYVTLSMLAPESLGFGE